MNVGRTGVRGFAFGLARFARSARSRKPDATAEFLIALNEGPRYAALLTLALNCVLCDVNPFTYFTELFDRIAAGWPKARAAELLPQAFVPADQLAQ